MSAMLKGAIRASEAVEARMNRARYKIPAHKREKYFGGYREKLQEAKMRAALEALKTPDHDTTAALVKPGDDRTKAVYDWNAMIDAILKSE